jgi:prevent-host-death family protein
MSTWKLETAKARLSELLRQAREDGPQIITVRGAETAVVLSADDFRRLANAPADGSWVDRFRAGFTGEIDLARDADTGRDVDL